MGAPAAKAARFDPSKDAAAAARVEVLKARHARAVARGEQAQATATARLLEEEYGVKVTAASAERVLADQGD